MDGYCVESPLLKEVRKLINKGEWKRSKTILKDLVKDGTKFASLCQIDKCFVTRFLGERYNYEKKFEDAVRLHEIYSKVASGLPVEEQRAYATLGSTFHDFANLGTASTDPELKESALEKAELNTMKAVKAAKQLLSDCLTNSGSFTGVGRIEAGHMMARGLYNIALIEVSRGQTSKGKAVSCLEKALRVMKDYVVANSGKQSSSANVGSEVDAFHVTLYEELAMHYQSCNRFADLWQLATEGVQLAEKLLADACEGRSRVKARRRIAKFLMYKARASLNECHFDIAARLANEALKILASKSLPPNKAKRRRVANEYAADFDNEDDCEFGDEEDAVGMSTKIEGFKRTCRKLAKLSKKFGRLQKASPSDPECSKLLEKIADLLFDQEIFERAKTYYEQALLNLPTDKCAEESQINIIVSIGRCLLSLGGIDFDQFVSSTLKSTTLRQASRDKLVTELYEVAVDNYIENAQLSNFTKYLRLEMDARRIGGGDNYSSRSNTLHRRFAEIAKKIDGNKSENQMKTILSDLTEELLIDKNDVDAAMAQLVEEDDEELSSNSSSIDSSMSSSEDEGSSDENGDDKGKKLKDRKKRDKDIFLPIRLKRNEKAETQLHVACRTANVSKAEYLLKAGHPVNINDGSGYFPMHDAADAGSAAIVALLLANGADANCTNDSNGVTPAMEAAKNGNLAPYRAVLRVFLTRGNVNWDVKDNKGKSALQLFRESRREHEPDMSSDDLADWMELESLMISKMRKKPPSSTMASTQQQPQTQQSATQQRLSNASSTNSNKIDHRRKLESSSSSSNDEDADTLPTGNRTIETNNPVLMYQSAIGGISRSAKAGKRKVIDDGDDDSSEDVKNTSSNKKKKRPEALKALIANDPFLDEHQIANEDANWLVDDVGVASKQKQPKTTGTSAPKRQQAKRQQAINALENIAKEQARFCGDDDKLVAAVLAASAKDNENVEGQLLQDLFGDDDEGANRTSQKQPVSLSRSNSLSILSSSSSKGDLNEYTSFVNLLEDGIPSTTAAPSAMVTSQRSIQPTTSFNSTTTGGNDFLTIRVHLERDDPSSIGGRRRDTLLINNIVDSGGQWDIKRLRHETKVRYAALFGQSPVITSMRLLDGATLADDSRLAPIARQHGELLAIIDRWDLPPLLDRYTSAANLLLSLPSSSLDTCLANALSQAEQSGRLDIRDLLLQSCQLHCVFKALLYQTNISSLCLSGNRFGSGSAAGSSSLLATAKAFADMLVTLPNLVELDLSLCNTSDGDLEQITQALTSQSTNNFKSRLRRLNLSFNSFCPYAGPLFQNRIAGNNDRVAESLATLLRFFSPSLRRLSLASCELDGESLLAGSHDRLLIREAFQSLRELNELDLSHNRHLASTGGLEFLLIHALPSDQLTVLRLDGIFPLSASSQGGGEQHQQFGRILAQVLNNCTRLAELSLSSNGRALDDEQVTELANSLERARCLTTLDLSANSRLGSHSFLELARALPRCRVIRLDLSSTSVASPLDLTIFDSLADKMDSPSPLAELLLPLEERFTSSDVSSLRQVLNCSTSSTKAVVNKNISCSLQFV